MAKIDLVGQKFGRLLVIEPARSRNGVARWICKCECGTIKEVNGDNLKSRHSPTRSCGCLNLEKVKHRSTTHGEGNAYRTVTPEYRAWQAARGRCFNPNNARYSSYGGRGITMCREWSESYETFLRDMGRRPSKSHSLDRYPNNDGNYEPGNTRWATQSEQIRNSSKARPTTALGITLTLVEWSERTGIPPLTIRSRLEDGWDPDLAVTKPVDVTKRNKLAKR